MRKFLFLSDRGRDGMSGSDSYPELGTNRKDGPAHGS